MAGKNQGATEINGGSPAYYENDMPMLFKLFFIGLVIWGILFSAYFLLTGYDSEKRFDSKTRKGIVKTEAKASLPERMV